jgi:hypothetical protein
MAEKVLFEYRAQDGENGCEFHFGHGTTTPGPFGPFVGICCRGEIHADVPRDEGSKSARRPRERSRRNVRDTLDLLERMFHDLYGGEEANESRTVEP